MALRERLEGKERERERGGGREGEAVKRKEEREELSLAYHSSSMHALRRALYPPDKNPIGRANGTKPGVIAGGEGRGSGQTGRGKKRVRMIDEVGKVKMEVTVRTLNSAKLKWKLSRNDFVSRARSPREPK